MSDRALYPVFLSLGGMSVLVLGFGDVGRRKLAMLVPARPRRALVLDPAPPSPEGLALLEEARGAGIDAVLSGDPFGEEHLDGISLVFACSSDRALNRRAAALCAARNILCNCAGDPPAGTFHVPAVARAGSLAAAVSTDGASPALARRWKGELAAWLAPKAPTAALLGRIRPRLLALGLPSRKNAEILRALSAPELESALALGDAGAAAAILAGALPEPLRGEIPSLLGREERQGTR